MTRIGFARVGFSLGLFLLLSTVGCEQGPSQGSGQKFSELPETKIEVVEPPLVAPKPDSSQLQAFAAAKVDAELPLRAVKPVFASNLSGLRENLDNRKPSATATGQPIKLLIPDKTFRPDPQTGVVRISYDDFDLLKVLNMEPVPVDATEHFPGWLRALDGKTVRVRGFMYPPQLEEGLTGFVLARDNQICCFGREAKVYDLVNVFLKEGESTHYIQNRPFDVVGTFRINPLADDTTLFQLYEIEDAKVIER